MSTPTLSRRRTLLAAAVALSSSLGLVGCADDATDAGDASEVTTTTSAEGSAPSVLASTSWIGAIAQLAGADDVNVVAPSNLQHPPDYDPKPSDLAAAAEADYVLLAGFEGFAPRLTEAVGADAEAVTVATSFDPEKLAAEVHRLAEMWGTTDLAEERLAAYTKVWDEESAAVREALGDTKPVIVAQAFVAEWVGAFAGLEVAGVYGEKGMPAPSDVSALAALKPAFVAENAHMPMGGDLIGATGATKVELVNFPGDDLDLAAVVRTNAATITSTLAG